MQWTMRDHGRRPAARVKSAVSGKEQVSVPRVKVGRSGGRWRRCGGGSRGEGGGEEKELRSGEVGGVVGWRVKRCQENVSGDAPRNPYASRSDDRLALLC